MDESRLQQHRKRNQTAFHCGKCGKVFASDNSSAPEGQLDLLKAFETHECVQNDKSSSEEQ
jgi:hypothetical protein